MRPIPKEHREQINSDPYFKRCLIDENCEGKVEIHHSLIYNRKQINEMYVYQPLCEKHHADKNSKLYAEYLSIKLGLKQLEEKYPKYDWKVRLDYLSTEFGSRIMSF